MTVNTAKYEESTEIVLDSQVEVGATGWTFGYCAVNRVGNLVHVHLEATNAIGAAALVTTLQSDFAPGDVVTDSTGNFTVAADGSVSFTASKAASLKRVLDVAYQAALVSP